MTSKAQRQVSVAISHVTIRSTRERRGLEIGFESIEIPCEIPEFYTTYEITYTVMYFVFLLKRILFNFNRKKKKKKKATKPTVFSTRDEYVQNLIGLFSTLLFD